MATSLTTYNQLVKLAQSTLIAYEANADMLRFECAKQFVLRMHTRYLQWKRRNPGSYKTFLQWLVDCRLLERTFVYDGRGAGDVVRRRWALRDVKLLRETDLHRKPSSPSDEWVCELIEQLIEDLVNDEHFRIVVEYEDVPKLLKRVGTEGRSLRFLRVERTKAGVSSL